MIGVLVSQKSLQGKSNQWPNRYPKLSDVPQLMPEHPMAFNVIHFNTDDPTTISYQLSKIVQVAGPDLHGIQLNMAWPSPEELHRFNQQNPDLEIILQINQESVQMVRQCSDGIVTRLKRDYRGLVSHILLDLSAGYGLTLDTDWCRRQLLQLQTAELGMGLGVAGGLSPETIYLIEPLIQEFPDLSIDAEARLRDENDNLVMALATEYLERAFAMFGD